MAQKLLILGCGYVGLSLAQFWTSCGIEVTATTTSEERVGQIQPFATHTVVVKGNDKERLTELVQDQDAIVITVAAKHRDDYQQAYVETAQTLAKALQGNTSVKQLVYTGSASVYGDCDGEWVSEERDVNPNNTQTEALVQAEQELQSVRTENRKVCIMRLGEILGPERGPVQRLKSHSGETFPGTGTNYTNMIHVDDIVSAVDFAVRNHLDGIYNLCNDLHLQRKEVYDILCTQLGLPVVKWEGRGGSIHAGNKRVDSSKLRKTGFVFVREGFDALLAPV